MYVGGAGARAPYTISMALEACSILGRNKRHGVDEGLAWEQLCWPIHWIDAVCNGDLPVCGSEVRLDAAASARVQSRGPFGYPQGKLVEQ